MKHIFSLLIVILAGRVACPVSADEPLHARIDRRIEEKFAGAQPSPATDDASFLRRIHLDLAGVIPTAAETREFLADPSPDKRTRLIDRLMSAPSYARRMRQQFHVMLMERRGDDESWDRFLRVAFERNMPWNEMARAMLHPPDTDEDLRGAAFFYTKRLESYGQNPVDYPGLTRDVGRLFLGVDLQCAQCHDHLFIDDYKQREFQGLYVIYKNMSIRQGPKFPAVDLKPIKGELEFVSVFEATPKSTGPRIPFDRELTLPAPSDESATTAVTEALAHELTRDDNLAFSRNIVNRLWFLMMGRGLFYPLDLHHSANPPSHPELLDELAREFVVHGYDIRWLLREIALSGAYQRSSVLPADAPPPPEDRYLVALEKRLSAEQLLASVLRATGSEAIANVNPVANSEASTKASPEANGHTVQATGADMAPSAEWKELQTRFLAAFANEPREPELEYEPSVKAALFLSNDPKLLELLSPRAGNLVERLSSVGDPEQVSDELFVNILSRNPTAAERDEVRGVLERDGLARESALRQLAWALLTSMEFCVNH